MSASLEAPTEWHIQSLIADVRPVDREEWALGTERRLDDALRLGLEAPQAYSQCAVADGQCIAIWGAHSGGDTWGQAWLITTNSAVRYVHALHHHLTAELWSMHAQFPRLYAWSFKRNYLHHKWMRRWGFVQANTSALDGFVGPFILFTRHQG